MLDLVKLATLQAVAESGSFTAAAAALHLTQPAVSRQIATLERLLGTPLLHRVRGHVQPTAAGRLLLAHARAAIDRLTLAETQVRALASAETGRVRLGSFFTALVHLSAEVAALLGERHPELVIVDDLVDPPTALSRLARGELDLALVFTLDFWPVPVPDTVRLRPLFDDPVRVLLPIGHPAADRAAVDLADLAEKTWIRAHDGSAATLTDHILTSRGLTPRLLHAGRGDEPVESQALVAAGRGITLAYDLTVVVSDHQLTVRPITGPPTHRHVAAALPEGPLTPTVTAAFDALCEAGRRRRTGLTGRPL
jgi:DNA-binding transcriptional LysR family regulator